MGTGKETRAPRRRVIPAAAAPGARRGLGELVHEPRAGEQGAVLGARALGRPRLCDLVHLRLNGDGGRMSGYLPVARHLKNALLLSFHFSA